MKQEQRIYLEHICIIRCVFEVYREKEKGGGGG